MDILVGYKKANQNLLEFSAVHAKAFNANVILVTSLKGGDDDVEKVDKAKYNLEAGKQFFDQRGIQCETHLLVHGMEAGEDLVSFAQEKSVFQIIMGVKNRSKVGKLLFGSTAQTVILTAPCPVLTVKGQDAQ